MNRTIKAVIAVVIVLSFGVTAFAATTYTYFSDEKNFAVWFSDSAKEMRGHEIINGYPDGSFGPEKSVNRAELSVILDKFADVLGKPLDEIQGPICTFEFQWGLALKIYDINGNPVSGAKISVEQYNDSVDGQFNENSDLPGNYIGLGEANGYYTIRITKPGFTPYEETIKLEQDGCHVIPQTKTILLVRNTPPVL